jgi:phenylalanyl-tRNA synthetase alpha chain
LRDCIKAFADMGFRVAEGPEVEWARYNFDAVRIPEDHPARDMWDTIWVDTIINGERSMLLRTHTSPNQIRVMERQRPPIRVIVPGKCYRQEATDATHEWMLTQIEGLAVDEARMSDSAACHIARQCSPRPADHLPPLLLPFVEPVEMAIDCSCRFGAAAHGVARLIEILGAGMHPPEIIDNAGYTVEAHRSLRHGVERVALLRWGTRTSAISTRTTCGSQPVLGPLAIGYWQTIRKRGAISQ